MRLSALGSPYERRHQAAGFGLEYYSTFTVGQLAIPISLTVALLFGFAVLLLIPIADIFLYNFDEGFEVTRATLQNQGYVLYKEIWSDQPPLFSLLLSTWLKLFGNSIFWARALVVLFGSILVFFFHRTIRFFFNNKAALFGTVLLIFSRDFIKLLVQVKIDIPALAIAMAAIHFFILSVHSRKLTHAKALALIAGVLACLALQTKLFTIAIIPVLLIYALIRVIQAKSPPVRKTLIEVVIWCAGSCVIVGSLSLVLYYLAYGGNFIDQLLVSHVEAGGSFQELSFTHMLTQAMKADPFFWLITAVSLAIAPFSRYRNRLYFAYIWLLFNLAFFYNHQPIWPHYYLLFALPMAWIASFTLFSFQHSKLRHHLIKPQMLGITSRSLYQVSILSLIVFILTVYPARDLKFFITGQHNLQQVTKAEDVRLQVLDHLAEYAPATNWLATDYAMMGFYANLKVPPELAVLSRKRVLAQDFDGEDFLHVIQNYQPEQIVLGRFVEGRFERPFLANAALKQYLYRYYIELPSTDRNTSTFHHFVSKRITQS